VRVAGYGEYVVSGSRWLDEIPAHWRVGRLEHVASTWTSNVDKHSVNGQPGVRLCNYTDVYKHSFITSNMAFMQATASAEQIERFRLRLGDTIITKDSETADDIGIPAFVLYEADDLLCGYHLAMVRPNLRAACPKFIFWALGAQPTLRQWAVVASGVTRVGIRSGDLAKATIPLPPLGEQRAIAHYLDRETAQIDALIEEQERLIEVLRERKRAVLDEVTSSVAGKAVKLKYLFAPSSEANHPAEEVLSVYRDYGVIKKASRDDNFNRTPPNVERYLLVRPGDLVVNRMKAWQGSLGVSEYRGIVSGDYEVVRPFDDRLMPRFAHLFLRSPRMIAEYAVRSTGIRPSQWRLYWGEMGQIEMPVPAASHQESVVWRIDEQTSKIGALIAESERFIELARERRSALITAAVTGQIDVRGEVA
jgi:type I restriction enzyme S subunit